MNWVEVLVELAGVVVAYLIGRKQGRDSEKSYQLSLGQATPRIGSRAEFIQGVPAAQGNQFRYAIETTIYNDGGLVASKLDGNWKLSSSDSFLDANEVIRADSLPAFLPMKLNHDLGYHRPDTFSKPEVIIQMDVDLTYLGFEDRQEKYQVTYKYEPKNGKMIQAAR